MTIGNVINENIIGKIIKERSKENMVLRDVSYDFKLNGSNLCVKATRTFVNESENAIEAIMTFPVPVEAVVYNLEYEANGRRIRAIIQKKAEARETYEEALNNSQTAVLHEELVKGIHMLSIGNIPSGATVKIQIDFAILGQLLHNELVWNIPQTVGQVYGTSPLDPVDDFTVSYAPAPSATYTAHDNLLVNGSRHTELLPLNKNIVLRIASSQVHELNSVVLFDGTEFARYDVGFITPSEKDSHRTAVLFDISGSMQAEDGYGEKCSRYEKAKNALHSIVHYDNLPTVDYSSDNMRIINRNRLPSFDLFAFNNDLIQLRGTNPIEKLYNLPKPSGGTSIGTAILSAIKKGYKNIIVITDGLSYDIDIAKIANHDVRINSVLVSEEAFDATMGHLSILTGGEVLFAMDDYTASIRHMLKNSDTRVLNKYSKNSFMFTTAGRTYHLIKDSVCYPHEEYNPNTSLFSSFITRFFSKSVASSIAEKAHFVSSNTSLILVDSESQVSGLPVTVKVPVYAKGGSFGMALCASSAPMGASMSLRGAGGMFRSSGSAMSLQSVPTAGFYANGFVDTDASGKNSQNHTSVFGLVDDQSAKVIVDSLTRGTSHVSNNSISRWNAESLNKIIPWTHINDFIKGDFSSISKKDMLVLLQYGQNNSSLIQEAKRLNISKLMVVILEIAKSSKDRNAQRLVKHFYK